MKDFSNIFQKYWLMQHCTRHLLLLSVYNCAGSFAQFLRGREEAKSRQRHVNYSVLENRPLNLPPFNCTVLYKNVLNVLVLGIFICNVFMLYRTFPCSEFHRCTLKDFMKGFDLNYFSFLSCKHVLPMIPLIFCPSWRKIIMNVITFISILFFKVSFEFHYTLVQTMHGK